MRGQIWELSLGNSAGVTPEAYHKIIAQISPLIDKNVCGTFETDEESLPVEPDVEPEYGSIEFWARSINVDLPRTYPVLAFFHVGGPFRRPLHEVLLAYALFRPEIGYVQGMSYLVAMLLLNMDAYAAFKCLANMIEKHPHMLIFLRMDMPKVRVRVRVRVRVQVQVRVRFRVGGRVRVRLIFLRMYMPKVSSHHMFIFYQLSIYPVRIRTVYLIECCFPSFRSTETEVESHSDADPYS